MPEQIMFPETVDPLIRPVLEILTQHGFKTFESCQGGDGHTFPEPTVRFEGSEMDLLRAFEICKLYTLPVHEAKRVFRKQSFFANDNSNALVGEAWEAPFNELIFLPVGILSAQKTHKAAVES